MAGIFDKIKDLMFGEYIDPDDPDDGYDDGYEESPRESYREQPYRDSYRENTSTYREKDTYRDRDREMDYVPSSRRSTKNNDSQVVSIHTNVQMQVVIIKPECYEDAQEICDQIKNRRPVVVNLEKVEFPIAQRIMDFLSGTCYSLEGSIQRVANNIFVIAPENVDISGDFKEELKTKGIILPWVNSGR